MDVVELVFGKLTDSAKGEYAGCRCGVYEAGRRVLFFIAPSDRRRLQGLFTRLLPFTNLGFTLRSRSVMS